MCRYYINVMFVKKFFVGKYQVGNNLSCIFSLITKTTQYVRTPKETIRTAIMEHC